MPDVMQHKNTKKILFTTELITQNVYCFKVKKNDK